MMRPFIVFCAVLLLAMPSAGAKLFDSPESVSYIRAEVLKEGSLVLESTGPGARASSLEIRHSVPQGTLRQTSRLKSVQGPDSYAFDEDEFGNEIIVLSWSNPPLDQRLDYSVTFEVEVTDRDDAAAGTNFPITGMTEPSEDMTEKAFELTRGLTSREKFMEMTAYVYSLVDYDRTYQNVQKSAKWVFENKVAVCDGHANLLISMLKALGCDAYYVIGYAYTEENIDPEDPVYWGPHGWVEVEYEGEALSLDPTWLEHPVDATHIKFATGPDSNYTEYVQIMSNNVRLDWDKGDYVVRMLDSTTRPRVEIDARLVPEDPGSGEHAFMITDVTSPDHDCVLTSLKIQTCMSGGMPFLEATPEEADLGFCGSRKLYWLLGTPDLKSGMEYSCGVSVYGGGAVANATLRTSRWDDEIDTRMSTPKVLTPGQFFRVNTTVENSGFSGSDLELFMMIGDVVQTKELSLDGLQAADIIWTLRPPGTPGIYSLRFFSSSGRLLEEDIRVVEQKRIEIIDVSMPENITMGDTLQMNITLKGLEDSAGRVVLRIGSGDNEQAFEISKGDEKTLEFEYTPASEGDKYLSVVILSGEGDYEDGFVSSLTVVREQEWWEPIIQFLRSLLEGLSSMLGMGS